MTSISNIIIKIFFAIAVTVCLLLLTYELHLWHAHDYKADYNLRQACIEVSPRSPDLEEKCRTLD